METIAEFTKKVDDLIYYLDDINGNKFYQNVKKDYKDLIEQDPANRGALIALQFLIIPFLTTREIGELLERNLYVGLNIADLDITERINKKLLFISLEDRDNCKNALRLSLVNNQEQVTEKIDLNNKQLKSVSDWIKDYIANIGDNRNRSLAEAQYFNKNQYFLALPQDEKRILKKLFILYNFLSISSLSPEGFEDDILIEDKDGRLVTTKKGQIIVLNRRDNNRQKFSTLEARTVSGPPRTDGEKKIDELKAEEGKYARGGLEERAIEEEINQEKRIEVLRIEANKYQAGSLEQKAVLEEIEKLKKL